jgi:hypothetical protein
LANRLTRFVSHLIGRYSRRMAIEDSIEDEIDVFHMDAMSAPVAMKANCDLQLTLMANSLYRLLAFASRERLRGRQVPSLSFHGALTRTGPQPLRW